MMQTTKEQLLEAIRRRFCPRVCTLAAKGDEEEKATVNNAVQDLLDWVVDNPEATFAEIYAQLRHARGIIKPVLDIIKHREVLDPEDPLDYPPSSGTVE